MRIGIAGLGTVGGTVFEILRQRSQDIGLRAEDQFIVSKVLTRTMSKYDKLKVPKELIAFDFDNNPNSSNSNNDKPIITRKDEEFYRIYPLFYWSNRDIWRYIRLNNLSYCRLYDEGYKNLGCKVCTKPIIPIHDQTQEKKLEKEEVIQRLRQLGYF